MSTLAHSISVIATPTKDGDFLFAPHSGAHTIPAPMLTDSLVKLILGKINKDIEERTEFIKQNYKRKEVYGLFTPGTWGASGPVSGTANTPSTVSRKSSAQLQYELQNAELDIKTFLDRDDIERATASRATALASLDIDAESIKTQKERDEKLARKNAKDKADALLKMEKEITHIREHFTARLVIYFSPTSPKFKECLEKNKEIVEDAGCPVFCNLAVSLLATPQLTASELKSVVSQLYSTYTVTPVRWGDNPQWTNDRAAQQIKNKYPGIVKAVKEGILLGAQANGYYSGIVLTPNTCTMKCEIVEVYPKEFYIYNQLVL